MSEKRIVTAEDLSRWIGGWMVENLELDRRSPDPNKTFVAYAMDSIHAMTLVGDLEEYLGCRLSPTLTWDYPSIAELTRYLVAEECGPSAPIAQPAVDRDPEADSVLLERIDELSEEEIDLLLAERLGKDPGRERSE